MKNDAVEKKDSDLLGRLQMLREKNIRLQEEVPEPEPPPVRRVWAVILFTSGISVAAFLIFLGIKSDDKPLENIPVREVAVKNDILKKSPASVYKRVVEKSPEPVTVEKSVNDGDVPVLSEGLAANGSESGTGEPEPVPAPKNRGNESEKVSKHTSANRTDRQGEAGSSGTYISDVAVAEDVFELNPKGKKSAFTIGDDPSVVVWTEIMSNQYPTEIRHIYFLDGRKYAEIPLRISHPRMRTWSRITLSGKRQAGDWSVSVVAKSGELLGEVDFTVTR